MSMNNNHSLSHLLSGATGINPFARNNHPVRNQMFSASHSNQMLPISGAESQWLQTGMGLAYGEYTQSIKMPCDGVIFAVVDKIPPHHIGAGGPLMNPLTTIIYEDVNTREIGCFNIPLTHTADQHFGFTYKRNKTLNEVHVGASFQRGTVFCDSPSKLDNGEWGFGMPLNVAFMTDEATSDDGIRFSDRVLDELAKYETIVSRRAEWGNSTYAKNVYGNGDIYRPHPEIGEWIHPSGLLMAFAPTNDPMMAAVNQNIHSARVVDYTFDTLLYAQPGRGRVVDIKYVNATGQYNTAEEHFDTMPQRYIGYEMEYHKKIIEVYNQLKRKQRQSQLTPAFHTLVKNAIALTSTAKDAPALLYRDVPIDYYRVEITIAYENESSIGSKGTNVHGGKGVGVARTPWRLMPHDQFGNYADIVVDPNTIPNRANSGVLYEQFFNSALQYMKQNLRVMFGLDRKEENQYIHTDAVESADNQLIEEAYIYVRNFIEIATPEDTPKLEKSIACGLWSKKATVHFYMGRSAGLLMRGDRKRESVEEAISIRNSIYNPPVDRIWITKPDGTKELTVDKIRIGPVYYVMLEKTGREFSAVSSARLQHFGIPGPIAKSDKHAHPHSLQPGRVVAEAEMRNIVAYGDEALAAEIIDRNGSPQTHKVILEGIYNAEQPTNIHNLVRRSQHPYGSARPLAILKHLLNCGGTSFQYASYTGE